MADIRNIVFDVGNVLVRWSPEAIVSQAMPDETDPAALGSRFFSHPIWRELNRGETTALEMQAKFSAEFGYSSEQMTALFRAVLETQTPVKGMFEMLKRARKAGYKVYALTDNVNEIIAYLKVQYDFWPSFHGAIVSSEVGLTKPDPAIYQRLLSEYGLHAERTIFTDDMPRNVEAAQAEGLHAFVFTDAAQCEAQFAHHDIKL
jgi:putative hydrolase of the HAD superfamily